MLWARVGKREPSWEIKMNNTKLVIPSCNDFMSIYGFDCEMDDVI